MPSIRIKGKVYSNLEDTFPEAQDANHITVVGPSSGNSTSLLAGETPRLHHVVSTPHLRPNPQAQDNGPSSLLNTPARPRALTTSSRVHNHCTSRTSQYFNSAQDATPTAPSPLHALSTPVLSRTPAAPHLYPQMGEMMTISGLQTDLRISSRGEPGLIENSINLSDLDDDGEEHHHDDVVEHLDAIDSQVGAVSNLTNAANSILIPPAAWFSRKPVVILPTTRLNPGDEPKFEDSLDRHVDDVLKRPSKLRRTLMGVWSFLKTPMGVCVNIITGIYGFLVVFWGAAIVVFLVKIINFHNANTQGFWVEVSSQVETGLFTVTSIGLIPSRVLDTYRIWIIWRYKRKTIKLRKKAGLPQLFDVDDLPDPIYDPNYVHVLTEDEQTDLHRQQRKFQYSQTWYRAHGTETHRAFPINMALLICFLNDGNSIFQIFLCGTMWGLNRFERPAWTTGMLIPASFLCGIGAAVVIWRGGERTKRVEEVREKLRAALADRHPPAIDGILPESLTRNLEPRLEQRNDLNEKPRDTLDVATTIDERMIIPSNEISKEV